MKLVAVSVVMNGADMIEAFIRHTRIWIDHHLVFDHASTDGTREILGALVREGLPLTLFTDDSLANLQQERSNHLARLACRDYGADWVLPLDFDEILTGEDRASLEAALGAGDPGQPVSIPLVNYLPTDKDDPTEINPILRLQYCGNGAPNTFKVFFPREAALDPRIESGMGNHALYRQGHVLPARPLPTDFMLAHFALRSPGQQAARVVLAELQKLSRGRAHDGMALHYRLGFQLLAESPERFFSACRLPAAKQRRRPVPYRGSSVVYTHQDDWARAARALLPYLESLARSHGALADTDRRSESDPLPAIRPLHEHEIPAIEPPEGFPFDGFRPVVGWEPEEGPAPEAFLPPFHWGTAPETRLAIDSPEARNAVLTGEALTYSENQTITLQLNGLTIHTFRFSRVNQKETLTAPLSLRSGENDLKFLYTESLQSPRDPRQLAVIFLSLRIV